MQLILVGAPLLMLVAGVFIGLLISAPGYKGPVSKHFDGKKFHNYDSIEAKGFGEVLKWALNRKKGKWTKKHTQYQATPNSSEEALTVYFVNHSTFLIQWGRKNFLTDPVWGERASPFSFAGPQRMRPPGIRIEDLPPIDAILLSHNHYDHLDIHTIIKIWKRDNCKFVVPLGVDTYLRSKGITDLKAMDWWDEFKLEKFLITSVPSQHFSGRGMLDRDKTLWCGYTLSLEKKKLYFVGDTGYNEKMLDDIRKKHQKIDLALIPIGAYKPRWFMSPIHIDPEQAVMLHKFLKIKKSIAMHYGTFPLADEGENEAVEEFILASKKYQIEDSSFVLLKEGENLMLT